MTSDPIVELQKLVKGGNELIMTDLHITKLQDGSFVGRVEFVIQAGPTHSPAPHPADVLKT